MLKAEMGYAAITNAIEDTQHNTLIENKQNWLAGEFDWPFLKHRWDVGLAANNQYQTFATTTAEGQDTLSEPTEGQEAPTFDLNTDRPVDTWVLYNLKWEPVKYGIDEQEYNIWDPTQGQANDPVQRWQYYDQDKFEVWPMPASSQKFRFDGQRLPKTLRNADGTFNDSAKLDLDDLLVVYFIAAEVLARSEQKDAAIKQQMAAERLRIVRGNLPNRTRKVIYGHNHGEGMELRKVVPIIGVHG